MCGGGGMKGTLCNCMYLWPITAVCACVRETGGWGGGGGGNEEQERRQVCSDNKKKKRKLEIMT